MPEYFFKHRSGNVYDIFIGKGWDSYAAITVGQRYARQVGGNYHLSQSLIENIHQTIVG